MALEPIGLRHESATRCIAWKYWDISESSVIALHLLDGRSHW